jgi:hypothetical protein
MKVTKQLQSKFSPPKPVETYEQLAEFNRACRAALQLIENYGRQGMIPSTECQYYGALLQEVRACVNQTVTDFLDQAETSTAAAASHERLKLEKKLLKHQ